MRRERDADSDADAPSLSIGSNLPYFLLANR